MVISLVRLDPNGIQYQTTIHEEVLNLWIKSKIKPEHLELLERRKPKGSVAQLAASKRRLEEGNITTSINQIIGTNEKKIKIEDSEDSFLVEYFKQQEAGKIDQDIQLKLLDVLSKNCH